MDPRVKPEDDEMEAICKSPALAIGRNTSAVVILGLDPRIHAGTSMRHQRSRIEAVGGIRSIHRFRAMVN
jgi:hypothetical protein